MTFDEFFSPLSKAEREKFAKRLGYHQMYLYGVSKKHRQGSVELAVLIEKATGGQVPCWEVRSELHPDPKKRVNGKRRAHGLKRPINRKRAPVA